MDPKPASSSSGKCGGLSWLQILRILGGICGLVLIVLGIVTMVSAGSNIKSWVNAFYQIVFGILIVAAELRVSKLMHWFTFLTVFIGFGAFYVFVGGLALGGEWYEYALGALMIGVGVVYCGMGCCCKKMEDDLKPKGDKGYQAGSPASAPESV